MRLARILVLVALAGICGAAAAQSIFNVLPAQGGQRPAPAPASPSPAAPTTTIVPPSIQPGQAPSSPLLDPKVIESFEQRPNETSAAYLTRMKTQSQRAVADMERASREHNAKIKALAPK